MMNKRIKSLFVAAVMLFTLTACKTSAKPNSGNPGEELQTGDSVTNEGQNLAQIAGDYSDIFQMVKLINDEQFGEYKADMFLDRSMMNKEVVLEEAEFGSDIAPAKGGDIGEGGGPDFSGTNNQVAGVQESDIVKTDGKHIFIASNNYDYIYGGGTSGKISVIKPNHGEMELISQISLENAYPNEMLLNDGKLIVIWNKSEYIDMPMARIDRMDDMGWGGNVHAQETVLQVYDLDGDFTQPISVYSQDGGFTSSRMLGDYIYLITNFTPAIPRDFEEEELDLYIPSFKCNDERQFVPAGCIVIPKNLDWVQYTVIGGLNVTEPDMAVSIFSNLGSAGLVYASEDNIYLSRSSHETVELDGLNYRYDVSYTIIDKFSIDAGRVDFVATGKSGGNIENQFRFDEHNGVFRAVTSVWGIDPDIDLSEAPKRPQEPEEPERPDFGDNWEMWDSWYNDVYMNWYNDVHMNWYRENESQIEAFDEWWWKNYGNQGGSLYTFDSEMNVLAEVHGIAKGENVQSVRFAGDIGYIVTFLQVDPLFSFDLSDPANPVKLDELKIPGFSRYLHPWSDGLLLGMGVDAGEDEDSPDFGRRTGLKLSMFDVSDNEDLSERHVYVIENPNEHSWSNSPVEWEHKAALVAPEKNIIGFPYSYSDSNDGRYTRTTVYAVFSYDDNGFNLIGEIKVTLDDDNWWEFNRGLYIDDYIYAIANNVVVSAKLDDELVQIQELGL
ncbi:MAG: beta-propeller domain-containing protein [Oscillospiraceae bacterium]|nr:beta-propeller domain-containing protein [Oscillospiraceae bacterium]